MKVERMKEKLKEVYPNQTWANKVDNMAEDQIIAIFLSMKNAGRLDKKNAKESYEKWKESRQQNKQLDFFDKLGMSRYAR